MVKRAKKAKSKARNSVRKSGLRKTRRMAKKMPGEGMLMAPAKGKMPREGTVMAPAKGKMPGEVPRVGVPPAKGKMPGEATGLKVPTGYSVFVPRGAYADDVVREARLVGDTSRGSTAHFN